MGKEGCKGRTQLDEESRQTEDVIKFRATANGARMSVAKRAAGIVSEEQRAKVQTSK